MARYILKTLGCKANLSDSQLIEQDLQAQGWNPVLKADLMKEPVNLCIINSCTVTDEADRQTRRLAAKLSREHPDARIVVTGCAAEVDPEGLASSRGVDAVIGNQDKTKLVDLLLASHILNQKNSPLDPARPKILGQVTNYPQILSQHPMDREWEPANSSFLPSPQVTTGASQKTRAFLKIQEGCDSFCTYCIIPYGRGPSRSLELNEVISQIQQLICNGIQEVILTGTNIGDYQAKVSQSQSSKPRMLENLIEEIFEKTTLKRLRVSSLDPVEITPKILSIMKHEPRFCPHFHVSLQSPHSRILRLMKRNYNFEAVRQCLLEISKLRTSLGGLFIGMDLITGFPGETQAEADWTYQMLEELPWSRLHVFPYSERKGTPATRLPHSIHPSQRSLRAKKLMQLSLDRLTLKYKKLLTECQATESPLREVLLERSGDSQWISGYTPNYVRVMIRNEPGLRSRLLQSNQIIHASPVDIMIDSQAGDVAMIAKILNE